MTFFSQGVLQYWLRLGHGGAIFAHIPETLAGFRLHAETRTLGQRVKVHAEISDMLKRRLGRVPDRWLSKNAYVTAAEAGIKANDRPRFLIYLVWRTLLGGARWNRWPSFVGLSFVWRMLLVGLRWNKARRT